VEYKRGHEARVTQFTSVADTPEMIHAKTGVSLASDVRTNCAEFQILALFM